MPCIIPINKLRDTMEISDMCSSKHEPIFITKNGYGNMVIMSMETYEEQMAKARNMTQLQKMENEKEQSENKDRIRTRQQEVANQKPDNTALYKTKSKAVQPVAMPK